MFQRETMQGVRTVVVRLATHTRYSVIVSPHNYNRRRKRKKERKMRKERFDCCKLEDVIFDLVLWSRFLPTLVSSWLMCTNRAECNRCRNEFIIRMIMSVSTAPCFMEALIALHSICIAIIKMCINIKYSPQQHVKQKRMKFALELPRHARTRHRHARTHTRTHTAGKSCCAISTTTTNTQKKRK